MGFLKEYKDIAHASKYFSEIPSEELFESFQVQFIDLIHKAYRRIKTPDPFLDKPDETQISLSLFDALDMIIEQDNLPCFVVPELHEYTEEIRRGKKSTLTAKRYDLCFKSWSTPRKVKFGVEAKLLIENNSFGRLTATLINEYVSQKGMGKFINGIYKNRGCMVGYVVEGEIATIVERINHRIETILTKDQRLFRDTSKKFQSDELYKSEHTPKLDYTLYHLMLQFS